MILMGQMERLGTGRASSVLIAACGIVRAAKHAIHWPQAHIVGIAVSDASIETIRQLKQKYDLANLELKRLLDVSGRRAPRTFRYKSHARVSETSTLGPFFIVW